MYTSCNNVQQEHYKSTTPLLAVTSLFLPKEVFGREKKTERNIWWNRIVNQCLNPNDWLENFCMSESTFKYICDELKPAMERKDTTMRRAIPVKQRVGIALWRLSTNSDYQTIAHLFGVSRSTVCVIVHDVCNAIVQLLLPKYTQVRQGARV